MYSLPATPLLAGDTFAENITPISSLQTNNAKMGINKFWVH
jgi:hypothetical protein